MENEFEVKVKFFDLSPQGLNESDEDEKRRLRLRFVKKGGSLAKWYEVLGQMQETVFEDVLLAPESHHFETLATADSD